MTSTLVSDIRAIWNGFVTLINVSTNIPDGVLFGTDIGWKFGAYNITCSVWIF